MRAAQPDGRRQAPASSSETPPERLDATLRPIRREEFGYAQARHLLWRAGFGGTDAQIRHLADIGPEKSVDLILDYKQEDSPWPTESSFDKDIMSPPSPVQREAYRRARQSGDEDALARLQDERQRRERLDREQVAEVQKWWLKRMIETGNPLEEKMTLFWHGLLATNYRTIENSYHMFVQNQLFRKHAVGSYADLMHALIRDPAMLAYLDNNDSRKDRPNENLAREIMELFSLGVGNYSERDIKEGARALTGYTFQDDSFELRTRDHDNGEKTILGQRGTWDGDDFVQIILKQPACSRYLARRMYHFFVANVPSDERGGDASLEPAQRTVIRLLASTLASNNYQLKPALRRLFLSGHFYEPRFISQQIKSPVQLVVGACRSLGTPVRDLSMLNDALDLMGQKLLHPPSVKGWEGGRAWVNTSTFFVRQNIMAFLVAGKRPQGYDPTAKTQPFDPLTLFAAYSSESPVGKRDPAAVIDALFRVTLGRPHPEGAQALSGYLAGRTDGVSSQAVTNMLLLITAMPEYQLC